MNERRDLTEKERAFVTAYATPGSDTYNDPTASAAAAGLGSPRNAGWRLLQRPAVLAAIEAAERQHTADVPAIEGEAESESTIEQNSVKAELQRVYTQAMTKRDFSTAARCQELLGKIAGAFADTQSPPEQQQKMTEAQQQWADALTLLIVSGSTDVHDLEGMGYELRGDAQPPGPAETTPKPATVPPAAPASPAATEP